MTTMPARTAAPMRALFRADASAAIGGGHVMRCLTLADRLEHSGWRCSFAVQSGTASIAPALLESRHEILEVESVAGVAAIERNNPDGADLLVVDHYGLDADFETRLRKWARRILVIDDLADRRHDCDLLLDQTAGRSEADYVPLIPDGTRVLTGARYALLNSAMGAARKRALSRRTTGEISRLLISFGLVDAGNATLMALEALDELSARRFNVDVVLGPANPHAALLHNAAERSRHDVQVHVSTRDMAELMCRADLAIGAAGTSSWERCCLGLPSVLVAVAGNQLPNLAVLSEEGAAISMGAVGTDTWSRLVGVLRELLHAPERVIDMGQASARLCDGRGVQRLMADLGPDVLADDGRPVRLTAAAPEHSDLMLAWQSAPGARRFSGDPRAPEPAAHRKWYARKLADPDCLFCVATHGGEPAAILRYDHVPEGHWVVSILVGEYKQRLGIGTAALALGQRMLAAEPIRARVKTENTASVRLFERAGFRRAGVEDYELPAARRLWDADTVHARSSPVPLNRAG